MFKTKDKTIKIAKQFCSETCLHGAAYLTSYRNRFELIWWIVVTCVSGIAGFYLVGEAIQTWFKFPLEWHISEERLPVDKITFPTVTICVEQV